MYIGNVNFSKWKKFVWQTQFNQQTAKYFNWFLIYWFLIKKNIVFRINFLEDIILTLYQCNNMEKANTNKNIRHKK